MPMIVWMAIALAILLIGGSTAINLPKLGEDMGKAVNSVGTSSMVPIAYAIAIAIVVLSVAFYRRKNSK